MTYLNQLMRARRLTKAELSRQSEKLVAPERKQYKTL